MKRFLALCGGSLLVVLLLAAAVRAEEIKNQYYTLDLPSGWKVHNKTVHYTTVSQEKEQGLDDVKRTVDVVLAVADSSMQNSVSIVVSNFPEITSAKEIYTLSCDVLEMSGYEVWGPVAAGESYVVEFSQGEVHGFRYFTVTGTLASTVTVVGDGGKELLQKHFTPVDPKLFPASYEGVPIRPQ